jgi:hypothetical protein
MECWENIYGERITIGIYVKATANGDNIESLEADKKYMVTSLKFNDKEEVMIGLNNGSKDSIKTDSDYFNITDLQPA